MAQPMKRSQTGAGSSTWIALNPHIAPAETSLAVVVDGTATYTCEVTYDDILGSYNYEHMAFNTQLPAPTVFPVPDMTGESANKDNVVLDGAVMGVRITVTAGSGTATLTALQAGIKND